MDLIDRYTYYTNNTLLTHKTTYKIDSKYLSRKQNQALFVNPLTKHLYTENYIKADFDFCVICNDGYDDYPFPTFNKTRKINNHNEYGILLKNVEEWRHWGPVYTYKDDIKWDDKKNMIIYRGTSTGNGDRINFVERYYKSHDVGLTHLLSHYPPSKSYLVKNTIPIPDFYKYKYIVSIEGNEKDSGINWKLASKSVVLMKPPIFESWLMEGTLQPFVHYVPLNSNLDNLDEMYEWCLKNDELCQNIVKNANKFMEKFYDLKEENKLINRILNDYKQHTKFETDK